VETQNYPISFHKLWTECRFVLIKLAFYLLAWLYFKESIVCVSDLSRTIRADFIDARNDVRAFIADQGLLSTSVLASDVTESEANAEK